MNLDKQEFLEFYQRVKNDDYFPDEKDEIVKTLLELLGKVCYNYFRDATFKED